MNSKSKKYNLLLFLTGLLLQGCVEPYDFHTEEFEELLVVEATITDEMKYQEITLSKTYSLEEEGPSPFRGASVMVSNEETEYHFSEIEPGQYRSNNQFGANPGMEYQLRIETPNGKTYVSDPATLTPGNQIDEVVAELTSVKGQEGIALMVNSNNPESASRFYKYEYEETYKIVSPMVVSNNLIPDGDNYQIVPNTRNETVCYNTLRSKEIILENTSSLTQNSTDSLLVRFIASENPVLAHRYSILVKQYSLSPQAFSYYSTLKKISGSESVFSENQPGFIYGNLYSLEDETEKVIGFFSLSSVSSQRIFFNYEDFYEPDGTPPMFPSDCSIYRPGEFPATAIESIRSGDSRFVGIAGAPIQGEIGIGPFRLVATECVDCTVYGTPEVPEFWEE